MDDGRYYPRGSRRLFCTTCSRPKTAAGGGCTCGPSCPSKTKSQPIPPPFDNPRPSLSEFIGASNSNKGSGGYLSTAVIVYVFLASIYLIHIYYEQVAGKSFGRFAYIGYIVLFVSSVGAVAKMIFSDDTFGDLRNLTDYATQVLVMSSVTTDLWVKQDVAPFEIAVLPMVFGTMAFFFFVALEYKRKDITDLVVLLNVVFALLANLGEASALYSLVGHILFAVAYIFLKRSESESYTSDDLFSAAAATACLIALIDFEPASYIPTPIQGILEE